MYNYRTILKRVGIVLIAIGLLEIAYLVYCLSQDRSYLFSLNILAIVAGVFLLRGSLRAVSIITWFAAFTISNIIINLILLPILRPVELLATEFRLNPVSFSLPLLINITVVILLFWVYKQLRAAPVVSASSRFSHPDLTPNIAFFLGAGVVLLPAIIMLFIWGSAAGAKAVELARAQYGQEYKYHITGMEWSNGQVRASLTAYNEREIKPVRVEWKQ